MKNKGSIVLTILILMIMVTTLLSFAYASMSATSRIENIMASVTPPGNAVISDISLFGTENGGTSTAFNYNKSKIYGSIVLPNANSSVTYEVDATVLFGTEMKISSITGLANNLTYELSNYTLGDPLCNQNNECAYGATDKINITIEYAENGYDSNNTEYSFNMDFLFEEVDYVARIGNNRYSTLQAAIDSVTANNTEVTINLLKSTSEVLTIDANKNIKLNIGEFTISNYQGNPVITNDGTLTIINGTITSNTAQGAINNNTTGKIYMSGGKIMATGSKQAIYSSGLVELSGSAYLSAISSNRPALHNLAGGTARVYGGTIISTRFYGIENLGTLTIGSKDGTVIKNNPIIQGSSYGLYSTPSFTFYDGYIEGKTAAVNNEALISDIEDNVDLLHSVNNSYKRISLANVIRIDFNPGDGTCSEAYRELDEGSEIGSLPTPELTDYHFDGWFTLPSGGSVITEETTFDSDTEIFAHWTHIDSLYIASIGNKQYATLSAAVKAVPKNNNKTTITLLKNTSEYIEVVRNQYIELNIGQYILRNNGNNPVIKNNGTIEISNGTILTDATQGAINNETYGVLRISGGRISATGLRQAIYNSGVLEISGSAELASKTNERPTINNLASGTVTITGGSVISTGLNAIENAGTLTVGIKDGVINNSSPLFMGVQYGILNSGTFKFYDGIFKGVTLSISGNVSEIETGSTLTNSTEVINNVTYKTSYLQ